MAKKVKRAKQAYPHRKNFQKGTDEEVRRIVYHPVSGGRRKAWMDERGNIVPENQVEKR